jgi:hypothetical protein
MRPYRAAAALPPVGYEIEFHVEFFRQNLGIAVRLLNGQDRADDAWQVLHGIHAGFEEGFDTPDLQQAAAMLKAWAATD